MIFAITELLDEHERKAWVEKHFHPQGLRCSGCGATVAQARDGVYYVVKGRSKMTVANPTQELSKGNPVIVSRDIRPHFQHYEDVALLIFFAPVFTQAR